MPRVKKEKNVKRIIRGPAASVSRRASSVAVLPAATRRDPSSASPLTSRKSGGLSIPVYSLAGRASGKLVLPKEIFGQKVNEKLLAQTLRVYMTNQNNLLGSTKTRGEVRGSTAKIYRQKGTGRARHGAIRAPIFVGGGIVFGPKPRKIRLELPKKMKKAALISALSDKAFDKNIIGLSRLEKASGKTKEMVKMMSSVTSSLREASHQTSDNKQKSKSALIVTSEKLVNIVRGVRNIPGVDVLPANLINAYEVLRHEVLMITKEAVDILSGKGTLRLRSGREAGRVKRV